MSLDFSKIRGLSKDIKTILECDKKLQTFFNTDSDPTSVNNNLKEVLSYDNNIIFKCLKKIDFEDTSTFNLSRLCSLLTMCDLELLNMYRGYFTNTYERKEIPQLSEFTGDKNNKKEVEEYIKKIKEIKKEYESQNRYNIDYEMLYETIIDNTDFVTLGDDSADTTDLESTYFNLYDLDEEYITRFIKDIYMIKHDLIPKIKKVTFSDVPVEEKSEESTDETTPQKCTEIKFWFDELSDASFFHSLFAVTAVHDKYSIISKVKSGSGVDIDKESMKSSF